MRTQYIHYSRPDRPLATITITIRNTLDYRCLATFLPSHLSSQLPTATHLLCARVVTCKKIQPWAAEISGERYLI